MFTIEFENKKTIDTSPTSSSEDKLQDVSEDNLKYIKKDGANHKSFYYNEKFYIGKRTEYFELLQLQNYENIENVTISGVEMLDLTRLYLYQTKDLSIYDCNLSKIQSILDLSKNKNLSGIWIFSDTYDENKEMYEKIQEAYPDIIVEPMIQGEL